MSAYEITEALPSAEEYNQIRQKIGWRIHDLVVVQDSLPRSLYGVCLRCGEELVGMGRVVGDGGMTFYIQDVIVIPEHQGQGCGALLMERLMNYIQTHAQHNAVVGLMAAYGKEGFYERYGFTRRPNEKLGAGMTIFWRKENQANPTSPIQADVLSQ